MDTNLAERRALVCGASRGIGRACAIELARLGAEVVLVAREADRLGALVNELPRESGQSHRFMALDFGQPDRILEDAAELLGGGVHILINNSGGPPSGPLLAATIPDFEAALKRHLFVSHILTQLVVPAMKDAAFGRIINIVSTSVKQPIPNLGVSNTVRGAMASWAKTLADELGPYSITVNNVLPGSTRTDRLNEIIAERARRLGVSAQDVEQDMIAEVPARRIAEPQEVAAVVAFLASPAAGYVNGVSIPVDGGRTKSF